MKVKPLYKDLISDIAFALGLVCIILGIFLLNQPETGAKKDNISPGVYGYESGYNLNYSSLITRPRSNVEVYIPRGSSGLTVGNILEEKGLVDINDFKKLIELFKFQGRIKAGHYIFESDASIAEILSKIVLD